MNRNSLDHLTFRAALCAAFTALAMCGAQAQNSGAPSYAGASIASTDYGTGLKVFLGGKVTPIFGWEGQITSFGSEEYGLGYKHSATAIGASGTARFPLNASLSAIGKAGLHCSRSRFFCTLPMALRGSSSTTNTRLGILKLASRPSSAQHAGFADAAPLLQTTTAVTPSPKSGCGTPITALRPRPAWR
jgi:hypothetical protein